VGEPVVVSVSPGFELTLEPSVAAALHERLSLALGSVTVEEVGVLSDEHPMWERSSGGSGHEGPAWSADDLQRAVYFYGEVRGSARVMFDLLLDRPGRLLTSDEIVELTSGELKNAYAVAGSLKGMWRAHTSSGRRYPITWWKGSPTRYGVRPAVAEVFNRARASLPPS
jgi:hypothetical protein